MILPLPESRERSKKLIGFSIQDAENIDMFVSTKYPGLCLGYSLCHSGQSSTWLVNQIVKNKSENSLSVQCREAGIK